MVLIDQANQGSNVARNVGVDAATGGYIQFLDADDTLAPEKITHQVECASRASLPPLVIGSYQKVDEAGAQVYKNDYTEEDENLWLKFMRTDLGITSSNLFKREAVVNAGKWDVNLKSSQEYDLMFRILKDEPRVTYSTPMHTTVLQRTEGSITSSSKGENWKRYIDLRLRIKEHLESKGIDIDSQAVNQIVFDAIRMLYPYDKQEATALFKQHIPSDFIPGVSDITGASYVKLFKLFGFKRAEALRSVLR